ncbi:MAG: purine-nucleoside phosphorylase [Planctomycetota bacterium]
MDSVQLQSAVEKSAAFLREAFVPHVRFGIILGTGAGRLADEIKIEHSIPYGDIPEFPVSTALGHAGELVCGTLAGRKVVAMKGRFHLYEGYPVDLATLPIHTMHALGVETLFVSNASGGINPNFKSGEIMLIDSHVDLMFRSTIHMNGPVVSQRPTQRSDSYDRGLIEQAHACGRQNGFPLYQGVYGGLLGPNYETRAEYRMLRKIGADVAGMSTVHEVTVAARHGIKVLGMSVITNIAKPDVLEPTSGQEVIDAAEVAAPKMKTLVVDAIENATSR